MKIRMCQQEVSHAAERTKAIKVLVNIKANNSDVINKILVHTFYEQQLKHKGE
jgi:hypothetical protein